MDGSSNNYRIRIKPDLQMDIYNHFSNKIMEIVDIYLEIQGISNRIGTSNRVLHDNQITQVVVCIITHSLLPIYLVLRKGNNWVRVLLVNPCLSLHLTSPSDFFICSKIIINKNRININI